MSESAIQVKGRPPVLTPGATLQDRYRIVRLLGKGGMGAVYEAVDRRLDVTVALKETFSNNDRLRRQFEQEAKLLAQLHHPALPRVMDYFAEVDRAFIVMQFIAGEDLAEIIANQPGPFPQSQVIAWADQLLDALIYLHTRDRQIVHRDIKPHNLKLTTSGQIALLDFGLAKTEAADASATVSSESVFGYTRRYSPLEQIQDQGTTPRSDIYALGATLYHLLTGVKPPDALARAASLVKEKQDALKPANEIIGSVGVELASVLHRAMALNSEDRFASAEDFRAALGRLGREDNSPDQLSQLSVSSRGTLTVSTTIAAGQGPAQIDPFDSYSILKPRETSFVIPKSKYHPALMIAILCVLLVGAGAALYNLDSFSQAAGSLSDFAGKDENRAAADALSRSKPQPQPSRSLRNTASPMGLPETIRADSQMRRDLRGQRTNANQARTAGNKRTENTSRATGR